MEILRDSRGISRIKVGRVDATIIAFFRIYLTTFFILVSKSLNKLPSSEINAHIFQKTKNDNLGYFKHNQSDMEWMFAAATLAKIRHSKLESVHDNQRPPASGGLVCVKRTRINTKHMHMYLLLQYSTGSHTRYYARK